MSAAFFYLLADPPDPAAFQTFVALPGTVQPHYTLSRTKFRLVLAITSDEQHAALLPQPAPWDGDIAAAKATLRHNDLIQAWWIFEHFLKLRDVTEFRS